MTKIPEDSDEISNGMNYAMFLLNIRLRTEGELRGKLKAKSYKFTQHRSEASGAGLKIIDDVIRRLKDRHYIDDQRYAEVFLENLKKYKSWGYYGVKKKLMEKKLPMPIIENVLSEGLSEEEELEIAKRFIKKANSLPLRGRAEGGVSREQRTKLARKLAAKGFRGSVVAKLVF